MKIPYLKILSKRLNLKLTIGLKLYEISMRFLAELIIKYKLACIQIGAGAETDPSSKMKVFTNIRNVFKNTNLKSIFMNQILNQFALKSHGLNIQNLLIFSRGCFLSNNFEKLTFYFHH